MAGPPTVSVFLLGCQHSPSGGLEGSGSSHCHYFFQGLLSLAEHTLDRKNNTKLFTRNIKAKGVEAEAGVSCGGLGRVALLPYQRKGGAVSPSPHSYCPTL